MEHNFSLTDGLIINLRETAYSDRWGDHVKYEIEIVNRDSSPHQTMTVFCSKRLWDKYGFKKNDIVGFDGHLGSDAKIQNKISNVKGLKYLLRNFQQSSFGISAWMKKPCAVCNKVRWEVRGHERSTMKCLNCGGELLNP